MYGFCGKYLLSSILKQEVLIEENRLARFFMQDPDDPNIFTMSGSDKKVNREELANIKNTPAYLLCALHPKCLRIETRLNQNLHYIPIQKVNYTYSLGLDIPYHFLLVLFDSGMVT